MQFLYRLIYHPLVNSILRGILKQIPGLPKKFQLPPSGTFSLALKSGKTFQLKTNQTCFVTTELFWRGLYDYEYAEIFGSLFEKTQVFFDVGSNIGLFSIMAGKINPEMKVFAFDPSPGPFAYLSENVMINKLANVKPLQMALSNQNGSFSFEIAQNKKYSYLKYNSLGGSGHLSEARPGSHSKSITVEAQKLDDFVKSNRITRLDLLKLDVEEAEHLVLEGAPETLKQLRPIVVCEVFSTEMLHQIQKQWSDSEYHLFIFEHKKLFPFPYSKSAKISRIENFFFVPSEKLSWLDSFIQA